MVTYDSGYEGTVFLGVKINRRWKGDRFFQLNFIKCYSNEFAGRNGKFAQLNHNEGRPD